jgi:hypothetical protein
VVLLRTSVEEELRRRAIEREEMGWVGVWKRRIGLGKE